MGYKKGDVVRVTQTVDGMYSEIHGRTGTVTVTLGGGGIKEADCFWVAVPGHSYARAHPEYALAAGERARHDWPLMSEEVELFRAAD